MKAIMKVERTHGGVSVEDITPLTPKANKVVLRIRDGSICGSDIHAYHFSPTLHFIQPPVIMGHEFQVKWLSQGMIQTDNLVSSYDPENSV